MKADMRWIILRMNGLSASLSSNGFRGEINATQQRIHNPRGGVIYDQTPVATVLHQIKQVRFV